VKQPLIILKKLAMKQILIFVFLTSSISLYSQEYWDYNINFDDPEQLFRVTIDTVANPANIWQIGAPDKIIFNAAYSAPNVIVTGLSNPYPVSDTSDFLITHIANDGFVWPHTVVVAGYYKSDADTLNDFGLIEFSPDQGTTWINLINSPEYQQYLDWYTEKPVLTGLVPEWTSFYVNIAQLGPIFGIEWGDTLYYRFSFISDGIDDQQEGLMYDDLHFEDWWENIDDNVKNDFASIAYPVPASSGLTIEFENNRHSLFQLIVNDIQGRAVIPGMNSFDEKFFIDTKELGSGTYYYKLINSKTRQKSQGKFIIEK
jgi:hypothetical protein